MRLLKILLPVFLYILISSSTVYAQVMIEQGKVVIKANPGESIVDAITIHNNDKKENVVLRVYWEDFLYVEPFDGSKNFMAAGTSDRSLSKWINFSPQQLSIGPLETKKINYSIQVPEDVKGGYYGVLFVETTGAKAKDQIGLTIVTRVGSLFFVEITNSIRQGKIENLKYTDKEFQGDFSNLGDVVLIPDATYYYLDKEGVVAERGEIKKFYLAPGKTVPFKVPAGESLASGEYTAVLTFDFGDGENLTHEFEFSKTVDGTISVASPQN